MANLNSILQERTKQSQGHTKMKAMAKQSAEGNLTSFSGLFGLSDLSDTEKKSLSDILNHYAQDENKVEEDLKSLILLTSEVKAINHQAALLHGERIKKAHHILTTYRDGAFTAWLIATYGNRQTPYNLMQYFEFYEAMPKQLRPQIESMPRQAIYVLASREGLLQDKRVIVENYKGETKTELLEIIRQSFPLSSDDKRKQKNEVVFIENLEKILKLLKRTPHRFTGSQKGQISTYLQSIKHTIGL